METLAVAGSLMGGVESAVTAGCSLGFFEGLPRCMRAGLGLVFPRCCRAGPSVSRAIVGRSTREKNFNYGSMK